MSLPTQAAIVRAVKAALAPAIRRVCDGQRAKEEPEHVPPQAHSPQDDTLKGIKP